MGNYSDGTGDALFEGTSSQVNTMVVYMNSEGDQGVVASIHKALLLSALTINASTLKAETFSSGDQSTVYRLANESVDRYWHRCSDYLGAISVGYFHRPYKILLP